MIKREEIFFTSDCFQWNSLKAQHLLYQWSDETIKSVFVSFWHFYQTYEMTNINYSDEIITLNELLKRLKTLECSGFHIHMLFLIYERYASISLLKYCNFYEFNQWILVFIFCVCFMVLNMFSKNYSIVFFMFIWLMAFFQFFFSWKTQH